MAVFVFLFFKLTKAASLEEALHFHEVTMFYGAYVVIVVILLWEILERAVSFAYKRQQLLHPQRQKSMIFVQLALLIIPIVSLFAYLFNYQVLKIVPDCCKEAARFWSDAATGYVIGLLILYYELSKHATQAAIETAREKEIIQKELFASRYEGLKNQVNPHFLFNSFSTLTSLVETDPKTAVSFIDKLSDLYRYVLEHEKNEVVTLRQEMTFLEDYVFLIKMRHQNGVSITNAIDLDTSRYNVPSLSVQTLVENAVKHNAFSEEEPLEIHIRNESDQYICVSNVKREKPHHVPTTRIGLKNLANRVRLSLKKELQILEDNHTFMVKLPIA